MQCATREGLSVSSLPSLIVLRSGLGCLRSDFLTLLWARRLQSTLCLNEFYQKQLIAPWAQSLVPETCRCTALFASLVKDSVWRAKADFPLVPLCPVKSMAPGSR